MAVNVPGDHPDHQDTQRIPALIQVGSAAAFASGSGTVPMYSARGGLFAMAGSGLGGGVTVTGQPSGQGLVNIGGGVPTAPHLVGLDLFNASDTSIQFTVINGYLAVWAPDQLVFAYLPNSPTSIITKQGAQDASAAPWSVSLQALGGSAIGQLQVSQSLPVVQPLNAAAAFGISPGVLSAGFDNPLAAGATSTLVGAVAGQFVYCLGWKVAVNSAAAAIVVLEDDLGNEISRVNTTTVHSFNQELHGAGPGGRGLSNHAVRLHNISGVASGSIDVSLVYLTATVLLQ